MTTAFTVSAYLNMSSAEKKKLIKKVVQGANKDQKALLDKYEQLQAAKA